MRSCTIVKAFVFSLGTIAVVARSLPEFSNNPTKRDGADGENFDISKPSHSYLSFPKPTRPFQKAMGQSGTTDVLLALSSAVPEPGGNATGTTAKLYMESFLLTVPKISRLGLVRHLPYLTFGGS
jgi:hypothetical protein